MKSVYFISFIAFTCLMIAPFASAQNMPMSQPQDQQFEGSSGLEQLPEKKHPSFFHRPSKDSPSTQLEFANSLKEKGALRQAGKHYLALVHQWHESPEASTAQFEYAKILENSEHYMDAFDEFQYLIENFAGNFPYEEALDHQFRIASYIMNVRRCKFLFIPGFKAPERSMPLWEKIVKNGPNWQKTPEAQFNLALIQDQMKEYVEAVTSYEFICSRYPNSGFAEESSYNRASCLCALADKKPRDEKNLKKALSAISEFLRDHPDSDKAEAARQVLDKFKKRLAEMYYERAEFYDRTANRPESALIMYMDFIKKFPFSDLTEKAKERIEALKLITRKDS